MTEVLNQLPIGIQIVVYGAIFVAALVWLLSKQMARMVSRTEPNKSVVDVFTPIQQSIDTKLDQLRTDMKEGHGRLQNGVDNLTSDVKQLQITSAGFGARLTSLEREVYRQRTKPEEN